MIDLRGQVICASDYADHDVRIRALVSGSHQSLRFTITTPTENISNIENVETYDSDQFWASTPGVYTIVAQLYSEDRLGGTLCDEQTYSFVVSDCGSGGGGTSGPCQFVEISHEGFESSYGHWNDGGGDCFRANNPGNAAGGSNYYIRTRDNSGASSSLSSNSFDCSNAQEIMIDFWYLPESMETGEDFYLEYSSNGGSSYSCLLYTSPSPRDQRGSRMPSSA